MKYLKPLFPTALHEDVAVSVKDFFINYAITDTVLIVNSCARGQAVAESDLDMAILVKENASYNEIFMMEDHWQHFMSGNTVIQAFKKSSPYAHLHIDIINGIYTPATIENGEPINYFEIEIGNQICYSAPIDNCGSHFIKLQKQWLPYYDESLRIQRLTSIQNVCKYDLDHIPLLIKRELHFQAFYILWKAFREYLQALFITNKIYPLAYNKWIKYQVVDLLKKPELYPLLSPVLSITNIESNEINNKADMLHRLLADL